MLICSVNRFKFRASEMAHKGETRGVVCLPFERINKNQELQNNLKKGKFLKKINK